MLKLHATSFHCCLQSMKCLSSLLFIVLLPGTAPRGSSSRSSMLSTRSQQGQLPSESKVGRHDAKPCLCHAVSLVFLMSVRLVPIPGLLLSSTYSRLIVNRHGRISVSLESWLCVMPHHSRRDTCCCRLQPQTALSLRQRRSCLQSSSMRNQYVPLPLPLSLVARPTATAAYPLLLPRDAWSLQLLFAAWPLLLPVFPWPLSPLLLVSTCPCQQATRDDLVSK